MWFEKTTVCRIFSCQRVAVFEPTLAAFEDASVYVTSRIDFCQPCRPTNLVENTRLEPVTSWLQTRRSPS